MVIKDLDITVYLHYIMTTVTHLKITTKNNRAYHIRYYPKSGMWWFGKESPNATPMWIIDPVCPWPPFVGQDINIRSTTSRDVPEGMRYPLVYDTVSNITYLEILEQI